MTAKPRRNAAQIAEDELAAARARTDQARTRVANAETELTKAKEALTRAETMQRYAEQHPNLPELAAAAADEAAREEP